MRPLCVVLVLIGFAATSCAQATEEDRKALSGQWVPDDGSGHNIEFADGGVFRFLYEVGPPSTVLEVGWKLGSKGKVDILQYDGSVYKTCSYSIEAGKLTIDDGAGAQCLQSATTPTTLMPKLFSKAP